MPELLLELFSEEIPARMQARGADELARLVTEALAALAPVEPRAYAGPRRIAIAAHVNAAVPASRSSERGPRVTAPEQALAGFLRKHGASRDALRQQGDFWIFERDVPGTDAAGLIAQVMPGLLRKFPWPKSMRWGGRVPSGSPDGLPVTSRFTWVRPLRRILCILDGRVVPFDLRDGEDDGHGLAASNLTEGHRFMAPGAFAVESEAQWRDRLLERRVIVDAAERRQRVWDGVVAKAAEHGLRVVEDSGLLEEVAGLVEWPVPLLGRIDAGFMDLPPEVMQVSMRVNQRYFALRDEHGNAAPRFAFAANIEADDGGAAIVAGNERVLRARFSDARHFWDLDRTRTLESRVEDLKAVTFHAKLGTQYERAKRLERIAGEIAPLIGANVAQSRRAGLLCKADLTTGMVGEFPELQGVMGGYYADPEVNSVGGEDRAVCKAIRYQYSFSGESHEVTAAGGLVISAVALADKIDQIVQFFSIGEFPTGSGDPFALRRAGLGIIRILSRVSDMSLSHLAELGGADEEVKNTISQFLKERLWVQQRNAGSPHDIVAAAFGIEDDRIGRLIRHVRHLELFLVTTANKGLVPAFRRAANLLRIENSRDGPHVGEVDAHLLQDAAERELFRVICEVRPVVLQAVTRGDYELALAALSALSNPLQSFFDDVTVNSLQPELRRNRLRLLASVLDVMHRVADFSKIEG